MLRFVLAIIGLSLGLHLATPTAAQAQDVWIQIEAKPSRTDAEERARAWTAMFDDVQGYVANSGWHVITLGPFSRATAEARLAELLRRREIPLIEDDIYGDIYFGRERPRPFAAFDRAGRVIYCASFSKTLAPGLRIGYLVAPAGWSTG